MSNLEELLRTTIVRRGGQKYLALEQKATGDNQRLQDLALDFPRTMPLHDNI